MPTVDHVQPFFDIESRSDGYCFVVRHDDTRLAATFDFKTREDALLAQQKMQEILGMCERVTGHPT